MIKRVFLNALISIVIASFLLTLVIGTQFLMILSNKSQLLSFFYLGTLFMCFGSFVLCFSVATIFLILPLGYFLRLNGLLNYISALILGILSGVIQYFFWGKTTPATLNILFFHAIAGGIAGLFFWTWQRLGNDLDAI